MYALRSIANNHVMMQLSQLSQVMATGSAAGGAHLALGLAACSAAARAPGQERDSRT